MIISLDTKIFPLSNLRLPVVRARNPLPSGLLRCLCNADLTVFQATELWSEDADEDDRHFSGIEELAGSIQSNGLHIPISITQDGVIMDGQRRFLAQALLVNRGHSDFSSIAATVTDSPWSMTQQLTVLVTRADLTAVDWAVNVGLLVAEIEEHEIDSQDIFISDDDMIHIPPRLRVIAKMRRKHHTWDIVVEKLTRSDQTWRNYLSMLRLCDQALEIAHRAALSEWALRPIIQRHKKEDLLPAEQVWLVRQAIAQRKATVDGENEQETENGSSPSQSAQRISGLIRTLSYLALLPSDQLGDVAAGIRSVRDATQYEGAYQVIEKVHIALQHSPALSGQLALETDHLATSLDYLTSLRPDTLDRAITEFMCDCSVGDLDASRLVLDRVASVMREQRGPLPRRLRDDKSMEASDDAS